MKNLVFLLLFVYQIINATTYYVAPDGNDNNPGTISEPWKTWTKAFKTAVAGDVVYFRGGVYYSTSDAGGERGFNSGTSENWIHFFNYPGETPILDCSNHVVPMNYNKGVYIQNAAYIYMKGLHIRNVFQDHNDAVCYGLFIYGLEGGKFENMVIHHVGGMAFGITNFIDSISVINCDAYNCCDSLMTNPEPPASPGQNGVGFTVNNTPLLPYGDAVKYSKIYFYGCRAWNFSDNGFDNANYGYTEWDHCWSFNGGEFTGQGCGWKYSSQFVDDSLSHLEVARKLTNCIGALNGAYGFSTNNTGRIPIPTICYNNTSYHNGYKGTGMGLGHGWVIMNYAGNTPSKNEMYANNIAFDNELGAVWDFYGNVAINDTCNSWDNPSNAVADNDDFVSLDWTEMSKPRKEDCSLPDINFMKLKPGSDLIDAGTYVGLPYSGNAPDLGAHEYKAPDETTYYPPVVGNIPDQTIAGGESFANINLNNYVSDLDNTDDQITWTCSGNSQLTVNINQITNTASIISDNQEWKGTETLTFTATDPEGLYDTDQATFTITASVVNNPPEIDNQIFPIDLEEFSGNFVGRIMANDPDQGQILTYTITNGNESGLFELNSGNGDLQISAGYDLAEALPEYSLTIRVADNGQPVETASATVKVIFFQEQFVFYIDPDNVNDPLSNGTIEHPYNSWNDITWEDGITCLQKKGTTSYESKININASNVTVGSYGEGEHPVIQSTATDFAIRAFEANNLYIKDLHINAPEAISCVYILKSTGTEEINNCIFEAADNGIRVIDTKSITMCYNTFIGCLSAIYSFSEVNNIYYNVFRNNQVAVDITSYLASTEVFNNVFYNNSTGVANSYSNLTLYNNIFNLLNKGDIAINSKLDKLISDYNIYYPEQEGFIYIADLKYNTLAEYREKTGLDLNSFSLDPKFIDVYKDNFNVELSSPAIDAGITVGLDTDFYGAKVPYGRAPDIGLAEVVPVFTSDDINVANDNQNILSVFPNPSSGRFHIYLEGINDNTLKVSVIDFAGRIFYEKYFFPDESELFLNIDISHIPKGIYLVMLITEADEKYNQRIIIE